MSLLDRTTAAYSDGWRDGAIAQLAILEMSEEDSALAAAIIRFSPSENEARVRLTRLLNKYQASLSAQRRDAETKLRDVERRVRVGDRQLAAIEDLDAWSDRPEFRVIRAPDKSILHRALSKTPMGLDDDGRDRLLSEPWEVLLIQHDWASVLSNCTVDMGEIRLPYDRCCFELVIGNRRVCALLECEDGTPGNMTLLWEAGEFWIWGFSAELGCTVPGDDNFTWAFGAISAQIRAVAITLDAEVVQTEITRAPYALNVARVKRGDKPLYDYHTLSLSARSRAAPLAVHGESGRHTRAHFRRGHWRRYPTHKTWIRWCIAGRRELGFVDKDYRI